MMVRRVVLFREPRESAVEGSAAEDPYEFLLRSSGFDAVSIPVLSYTFVNLDELSRRLREKFDGLVLTSPRAVQAVATCLENTGAELSDVVSLDKTDPPWTRSPIFVVGEATMSIALEKLSPFSETALRFLGAESNNASCLADFVIEHFQSTESSERIESPRLLYPASSIRGPTFENKLAVSKVACVSVSVYETQRHPNILDNIKGFTPSSPNVSDSKHSSLEIPTSTMSLTQPEALVFFSPSGVKMTISILEGLGWNLDDVVAVAIGPTTMKALEAHGYCRRFVAEKPTPEAVTKIIVHSIDPSVESH